MITRLVPMLEISVTVDVVWEPPLRIIVDQLTCPATIEYAFLKILKIFARVEYAVFKILDDVYLPVSRNGFSSQVKE